MNAERQLRRELAGLMRADNPPITGLQLLQMKSSISCIPDDLAQYEAALARYAGGVGETAEHGACPRAADRRAAPARGGTRAGADRGRTAGWSSARKIARG